MAIDRKFLDANHADLVAQIRAEGAADGVKQGRSEGATAELARIKSVFEQAMPGHQALVQELAFDGKTTGAEAAVKVLAAERGKLGKTAADIAADAALLAGKGPTPAADPGADDKARGASAGQTVEERCKAKWETDAAIRADFSSLAAYTALVKAEESGRIKILGAKKAA